MSIVAVFGGSQMKMSVERPSGRRWEVEGTPAEVFEFAKHEEKDTTEWEEVEALKAQLQEEWDRVSGRFEPGSALYEEALEQSKRIRENYPDRHDIEGGHFAGNSVHGTLPIASWDGRSPRDDGLHRGDDDVPSDVDRDKEAASRAVADEVREDPRIDTAADTLERVAAIEAKNAEYVREQVAQVKASTIPNDVADSLELVKASEHSPDPVVHSDVERSLKEGVGRIDPATGVAKILGRDEPMKDEASANAEYTPLGSDGTSSAVPRAKP